MRKNVKLTALLLAGVLFAAAVFAGRTAPVRADGDTETEADVLLTEDEESTPDAADVPETGGEADETGAVSDEDPSPADDADAAGEEADPEDGEETSPADEEGEPEDGLLTVLEEEGTEETGEEAEEEELLDPLAYPYHIADAYINGITDRRYTGSAIKQNTIVVQHPDSEADGEPYPPFCLTEYAGYNVSYKNNTKAGTATVTFTGVEPYVTGSYSKTFKITNSASWERLAGASGTGALGTQAKITGKFEGSYYAVIATNADFKDALSAVALAGSLNAPVLTTAKGSLSDLTKSELVRLGVKEVVINGTEADVSWNTEQQIQNLGIKTYRAGGYSASEKSVMAGYAACESNMGGSTSKTVIIATQKSFKDALSISPYAYATGSPIVYAEPDLTLGTMTTSFISSLGFTQAIIVGGPVAVPPAVETQLKSAGVTKINRLGGAGCYNTSRIIAEWEMGMLPIGTNTKSGSLYKYVNVSFLPSVQLRINGVGISRGDGWKDAIAGSALCGMNKAVLLLADGTNSVNSNMIKTYKKYVAKGYVFGGTQAVPAKVYNQFVAASK